MTMQYGFSVIVRGDDATVDTFEQTAAHAEALALDCLWVSDHLVMPKMRVSRYPGRADGQLPEEWRKTYYQPFSVLNFLAAKTQSVRLGVSVLILPMRNPIEVAAQIAEMDRLSRGRVNFGVGVGWYREEFEALGYRFQDRGRRTDDGLEIIEALWSQKKTSIDGPYYHFEEAELGPKPVQSPRPPIYIGGNSTASLKRLARHGDVWHPFKISSATLVDAQKEMRAAMDDAGRDGAALPIAPKLPLTFQSSGPADGQAETEGRVSDIIDALSRYRDAGATEFCFDIMTETLDVALDTMTRFAEEVRPHLED